MRDISQRAWEQASGFTLMDDVYMTRFFAGQPRCVEVVLRAVLDKPDLSAIEAETSHRLASLAGRSAILDVFARDSAGAFYDIEVQCDLTGALPERARFYASSIDSDVLPKGADFGDLPRCYVVFICKGDALGQGHPVCHVERTVRETGAPFGDGQCIVYVDVSYNYSEGELGDVMHDFLCTDPDAMRCSVLAERARAIKQFEEERTGIMGSATEAILEIGREEGVEMGRGATVAKIACSGQVSYEQIAEMLDTTVADVERCVSEYIAGEYDLRPAPADA